MTDKNPLLKLIYENTNDLYDQVLHLLDNGANPNEETEYFETPLRVASNNGRFDVVKLLFEYGANEDHLNWNELFHAIAYGSIDKVKEILSTKPDLAVRDTWDRTVFLLSIQVGDTQKSQLLLDSGADRDDKGRCGKTPFEYAIQSDNDVMLKWLIKQGFDFEAYNEFGYTPLIQAAEDNAINCTEVLIDAGADLFKKDRGQFSREPALAHTDNSEIAKALAAAGGDLSDISNGARSELIGVGIKEIPDVTKEEYLKQKHRVFGKDNPELCTKKFWYEMVRSNAGSWKARDHFEDKDFDDPAIWCYERYGKSITDLGNGEYIEIGGEHEDHYDPDFCIYNEVFYHRKPGEFEIYMYPKDVFPPTDSHTATLVGEYIYIIGCLGYPENRAYGSTPIYRLNIKTLKIDKIEAQGKSPGWIYNHKAYFDGKSTIRIKAGEVLDSHNSEETHYFNQHDYELCLNSLLWTRHESEPMTKEPEFFPPEYKQFSHSDGSLLAVENKVKWRLIKILKVHRVDVSKGETVLIGNEEVTPPVDDFLFVVAYSYSNEYDSLEALEQAKSNDTLTMYAEATPHRTVGLFDHARFLGFEDPQKEELEAFDLWKDKFDKGQLGII